LIVSTIIDTQFETGQGGTVSRDDGSAQDDVLRAMYQCQTCGSFFRVEYVPVKDDKALYELSQEVQSYPDGCPNCGSETTKLIYLAQ
jgi:hypothetical protein